MVKFRNLLSKSKASKKEDTENKKIKPIEGSRFNFKNLVPEEEKQPKSPQSSPNVQFKDIYPQLDKKLPPAVPPIENKEIDNKRSYTIEHLSPKVEKSRSLLYEEAVKYLRQVLEFVRRRRKFPLVSGFKIIHRMLETQLPYDPLFVYAMHQDHPDEYVVYHSVNVSIFAVKMAQYLKFSKQNQLEIGMAGLLHDVGMGLISNDILFKDGQLSKKELSMLRELPVYSYKILKTAAPQYPYLAESAYQIYERIDGSGYPNGLHGNEISEYAQIIGLVNVYEALIHSRPQREKFLHFNAVKEIMKKNKKGFQRKYLKALLNIFSIFPLSSYVRLNSGAIGKVVETYPDYPMKPKVKIVYDSQNQEVLGERILDLSKESLLHIVDAVSEEEIH
ncbi:MAG: HD domain-containing protein [Deltaproteobacteria bacterium]|nr:HD domain-containing protein [Deltaproteobacteria bacterium]MBW1995977.1 HD domain-containing protein [Deltaproteobacteria bacterium]MBW2151162.1 HD domain-containing protein [Deltaproteobacteria bacterium]